MKFTSFQDLYQQVKSYDLRLFDCLRRIENYIQQLVESSPSSDTQAPVVAFQTADLALTNAFQLVPGLAVVLQSEGTWFIEFNGLVLSDPADTTPILQITHGAPSKGTAGGQAVNDTATVANPLSPAPIQFYVSKSWIYVAGRLNDVIQVQTKKQAGAGVSAIVRFDAFGNQCSSIKAIYLGNYAN